jgi:hypothetical protein
MNNYSNCSWTASGELDCGGNDQDINPYQSGGLGPSTYAMVPQAMAPNSIAMDNRTSCGSEPRAVQSMMSPDLSPGPLSGRLSGPLSSSLATPLSSSLAAPLSGSASIQVNWSSLPLNFKKLRKNNQTNPYYFQTPKQKYNDLVGELGPPTVVEPQAGGLAIWMNPGRVNPKYHMFKRIEIHDEQVFNYFPYPHSGFLYTYVKIKIPIDILNNILSVCGDIMYDPIKEILVVRGMSIGYNTALIALICRYIMEEITWYNIIEYDLVKKMTHYKRLMNPRRQKRNMNILKSVLLTRK